jgi:hypothetical protein
MGIFKLLFNANKAEGIREAMRMAYRNCRRQAERGALPSDHGLHMSGMLGAIGSRIAVNGLPVTSIAIWHEVAPFAAIGDEEMAVEALAEYAVYVERTVDTKLAGLRETVNSWLRRGPVEDDLMKLLTNPYAQNCRWQGLLENDVLRRLEEFRAARSDLR